MEEGKDSRWRPDGIETEKGPQLVLPSSLQSAPDDFSVACVARLVWLHLPCAEASEVPGTKLQPQFMSQWGRQPGKITGR